MTCAERAQQEAVQQEVPCDDEDAVFREFEASLTAFVADASCTSLQLPHMTTGQRKRARKLGEAVPGVVCESFGFGPERRLYLLKKGASNKSSAAAERRQLPASARERVAAGCTRDPRPAAVADASIAGAQWAAAPPTMPPTATPALAVPAASDAAETAVAAVAAEATSATATAAQPPAAAAAAAALKAAVLAPAVASPLPPVPAPVSAAAAPSMPTAPAPEAVPPPTAPNTDYNPPLRTPVETPPKVADSSTASSTTTTTRAGARACATYPASARRANSAMKTSAMPAARVSDSPERPRAVAWSQVVAGPAVASHAGKGVVLPLGKKVEATLAPPTPSAGGPRAAAAAAASAVVRAQAPAQAQAKPSVAFTVPGAAGVATCSRPAVEAAPATVVPRTQVVSVPPASSMLGRYSKDIPSPTHPGTAQSWRPHVVSLPAAASTLLAGPANDSPTEEPAGDDQRANAPAPQELLADVSHLRIKNTFIDEMMPRFEDDPEPAIFISMPSRLSPVVQPGRENLLDASPFENRKRADIKKPTLGSTASSRSTSASSDPSALGVVNLPSPQHRPHEQQKQQESGNDRKWSAADSLQVRNTFIHIDDFSADDRAVQSMPHGMFGKCLLEETELGDLSPGSRPEGAPVEAAPKAEMDTLHPATIVTIEGLSKNPAFNGSQCVVQSFDEESGRYSVTLTSPEGRVAWAKVKREHLRSCAATPVWPSPAAVAGARAAAAVHAVALAAAREARSPAEAAAAAVAAAARSAATAAAAAAAAATVSVPVAAAVAATAVPGAAQQCCGSHCAPQPQQQHQQQQQYLLRRQHRTCTLEPAESRSFAAAVAAAS